MSVDEIDLEIERRIVDLVSDRPRTLAWLVNKGLSLSSHQAEIARAVLRLARRGAIAHVAGAGWVTR